ncbi:Cobalt ion binding protein [Quillaja saponaria]|uniref:Cobalt ion binding protein n=1 Tax=Quillaja saponaria TaxID=32244 RepID=A0AAD7L125_QUISA|nr:Cobalt ion binding protein [Quillaja saponaria]
MRFAWHTATSPLPQGPRPQKNGGRQSRNPREKVCLCVSNLIFSKPNTSFLCLSSFTVTLKMAFSTLKLKFLTKQLKVSASSSSSSSNLKLLILQSSPRSYAKSSASFTSVVREQERVVVPEPESDRFADNSDVPTSGICRPLSEILKELNKKVPDALIKTRVEKDGFTIRYIPWHTVNRIMNLHAQEWSGEVRSITYSADGKSVSVVYRVTLYWD